MLHGKTAKILHFGPLMGQGRSHWEFFRHNPTRARWIREQMWHPGQTFTELPDGGLELSFTVADFREVKMKILQFGADVEVLEPDELLQEVKQEVVKK